MHKRVTILSAGMLLLFASVAQADGRDKAVRACERIIADNYGVRDFRRVHVEKNGHHRF